MAEVVAAPHSSSLRARSLAFAALDPLTALDPGDADGAGDGAVVGRPAPFSLSITSPGPW